MADQGDDLSGPRTATRNLDWAVALVRGLAEGGVRHAVISPGSRSTPLVIAFNSCPAISIHVLPDERSAAFLGLGLARATGAATALVCTSGTAAANWYPAVVEASMDDVPLVLITADRPAELKDSGANQTIDQYRLYGVYPREFIDLPPPGAASDDIETPYAAGEEALRHAHGRRPGPVHINAAFAEPLVPPAGLARVDWPEISVTRPTLPLIPPDPNDLEGLAADITGKPGLILCGRGVCSDEFANAVVGLAHKLACPVIADPLSGLRWGPHERGRITASADLFLRSESLRSGYRPDWALQFGAAPTSASVLKMLADVGQGLNLVSDRERWADPSRGAGRKIVSDPLLMVQALQEMDITPAGEDWSQAWRRMDQLGTALSRQPDLRPVEANLVQTVEDTLPPGTRLFIGNSMVIRSFDTFATGRNDALQVFGNRGASGIDGNVSTLLGIASGSARGGAGPVIGVIGDLTLYHDMNGLLAAKGLDATIIVINNGGGGIFDLLPQRELKDFDRLWLTPTGLKLERVAKLYDLNYVKVDSTDKLEAAITESLARPGVDLIELPVDRADSTDRLHRLWAAATQLELDNAKEPR